MIRRLATMCLLSVLLIGFSFSPVRAQGDNESTRSTLKGINGLSVVVVDLPDGAMVLGLTKDSIQTDVELKLRLAGVRVMTLEEHLEVPGKPYLYIDLNLTKSARAASVDVSLHQNARLDRNGELAYGVATWNAGVLITNPTAQTIHDYVKDAVDQFLNAWLSVNPKK